MRRSLAMCLVLVLAASTVGQGKPPTKVVVTPLGFATVEGSNYADYFGAFRDGHYQFCETAFQNAGIKWFKRVGYRRDSRNVTISGRTWSSVTLDCCESKFSSLSGSWTKNRLTTPVRVFSSAVSWPSVSSKPAATPAVFSTSYLFPFTQIWGYSGKNDALLEYQFTGGTLANNGTWNSRAYLYYYFDTPNSATHTYSGVWSYGSSAPCRDSAHTRDAYFWPAIYVYPKKAFNVNTNDKLRLQVYSYFTAPGAQVVQAIDFWGSKTGTAFPGVSCNNLFIKMSASMLILYGTASKSSTASWNHILGYVPWNSSYVGAEVWTQAIWDDSKNNTAKLTLAGRAVVPKQPADPYRRGCVWGFDAAQSSGYLVYRDYANPIVQWVYQ